MPKKYTWYWNYIKENNKGRHDKTKEKLYRRVLSARSRWADKYNLDKSDIDKLIKEALGTNCTYCQEEITTENMSLDHRIPQDRGGSNDLDNLEIVCQRCNVRKGSLTAGEFVELLDVINHFPEEATSYVLQQLSHRSYY